MSLFSTFGVVPPASLDAPFTPIEQNGAPASAAATYGLTPSPFNEKTVVVYGMKVGQIAVPYDVERERRHEANLRANLGHAANAAYTGPTR